MLAPLLTMITSLADVPEPALHARLRTVAVLPPGARARVAVQLRDPELSGAALHALGERVRAATNSAGAALIVNDRLDLALLLGADGVHLGRRSVAIADARRFLGDGVFVSVACHGEDDVVRASEAGADAVLLSPIFATPGKGPPLGLNALARARSRLDASGRRAALIALGGVDAVSVSACLEAGADGVAAIRADLVAAAAALLPR